MRAVAAPSGAGVASHPATLSSIQCLRAIAALMVVYHHARDRLPSFAEALPSPIGQAGVDLFFVISGFIMVVTTWSRPVDPATFMVRRVLRIVPIYWMYTTLLACFILLFPSALQLTFTVRHYVCSLLFIPHESPLSHSVSPLLQPGWTLNYEMFFYVVFAACLVVRPRYRVAAVTLVLTALVLAGWALAPTGPVALTDTNALLLEFAAGAWIGHVHCTGSIRGLHRGSGRAMIAVGALLALATTALFLPERPLFDFADAPARVAIYGSAACLVVLGGLAEERARGRTYPAAASLPLRIWIFLGDASYSIYLTHLFTIGLLRSVWLRAGLGMKGAFWALLFVCVALAASCVAGGLAYRLVEAPITSAGQRLLQLRRRRGALRAQRSGK